MTPSARANLYPKALQHVDRWVGTALEQRSGAPWSSQSLCISVFGTIAEQANRNVLMASILEAAGVLPAPRETPTVRCEVRHRREVLNEYGGANPTCPDVLVTWPELVLTIESKFTEHLNPCGQVDVARRRSTTTIRAKACSGDHASGSDLKTQTSASCRLTVAENERRRGYRSSRRYWEIADGLFRSDVLAPPRSPCPFADGKYQLMRNLCFAEAVARPHGHRAGLVLAYVAAAPAAEATTREFESFRSLLLPEHAARVGAVSYETIAAKLAAAGETALGEWIVERIDYGLANSV